MWRFARKSPPPGAWLDIPEKLEVPGAGGVLFTVTARAAAGAVAGQNGGFIILSRAGDERRIPYAFLVTRPGLQFAKGKALQPFQAGNTKKGSSQASVYRYPSAPFGHSPEFGSAAVDQMGAEDLYVFQLDRLGINLGVAVEVEADGARIDPFVLGSPDENDVQGFAAVPVDVNALTDTYLIPNGAAGLSFPRPGRYYIAVDSGRDPFTGTSRAGRYVLRAWVDDLEPPTIEFLTKRVSGRQPLLAARVLDAGAGVDPLSMEVIIDGIAVGAARRREPRRRHPPRLRELRSRVLCVQRCGRCRPCTPATKASRSLACDRPRRSPGRRHARCIPA